MSGKAVTDPGARAAAAVQRGVAGVKSGLNRGTLERIAGVNQLKRFGRGVAQTGRRMKGMSAGLRSQDALERLGSASRMGSYAKSRAMAGARGAVSWATAADMKTPFSPAVKNAGLKRFGTSAARIGLAYGAMQVADFLNPFGFGSIDD